MRQSITLILFTLFLNQTLTRSCRVCGTSAYYDVRRPQHRYLKTVCGENGLTYKNKCYARCNEVKIAHRGACNTNSEVDQKNTCNCSNEWKPVMTLKGIYSNKCVANCAGLETWEPSTSDI